MDVSDGLAGDLAKLCDASGVSAAIDAPSIPLCSRRKIAGRRIVGIEAIVAGGDDYEVLCTFPEIALRRSREPERRGGRHLSAPSWPGRSAPEVFGRKEVGR